MVLVLGCADDGRDTDDTNAGESSTAHSSGPEAETGAQTGDETGESSEPTGHLRFVMLGDAGSGNDAQYAVADAMEQVCAQRGCEFVLYLGDNFYDVGVESVMDEQFQDKFELPYMDLDLPFYVALGNHDYGLLANQWEKSQYQIDYSAHNENWILPNEFYSFEMQHVKFHVLDTARLIYAQDVEPQREFIRHELANASDDVLWHIVLGHHPYISNGSHGNAGHYDGLTSTNLRGQHIQQFFESEVCGKAPVYFSGHDHDRQWLHPTCGTEFVVSGAGSKLRSFAHRDDNPTYWEDDQKHGFAWVEILDRTMTLVFYDSEGTLDYEGQFELP
jgi:tartrate-resistant acid phosphatase type 5